jgi:hypothetical protein
MPPFESTIQENNSHVKYVLTSKTDGDCGCNPTTCLANNSQSLIVLVETDWLRWKFFVVDLRPHPALWEPLTTLLPDWIKDECSRCTP